MLNNALSHAQLERAVPSAFATGPQDRVTEKYGFVPTIELVDAMEEDMLIPPSIDENPNYWNCNKESLLI